jgi:glycosyltransferase involved in cell wall biosynthesis
MKEITVIIPCYMQSEYVTQAIISCIKGTFPPKEVIVILMDPKSYLLAPTLSSLSSTIHCFCKEKMDVTKARNLGFTIANNEWVLPLDADDYLDINMLSEFDKYDGDVLHGYAEAFGDTVGWWTRWPIPVKSFSLEEIKDHDTIPSCSLVRKSVWKAIGGYNETFIHGCEDWEFWLNIKKHKFTFTPCPNAFYRYRVTKHSRDHQAKKHFNQIVGEIHRIHSDIFTN